MKHTHRDIVDSILSAPTPLARRKAAQRIAAIAMAALVLKDGREVASDALRQIAESTR
jgi:hypothetical protein